MSETGPPATPGERDSMPVCATCGSHLVMRDAWAIWNPIKASWELGAVFDATFCDQCGGETSLKWLVLSDWRTLRIRALNDDLRKGEPGLNDRFVVTRGVAEKAEAFLALTMQVVVTSLTSRQRMIRTANMTSGWSTLKGNGFTSRSTITRLTFRAGQRIRRSLPAPPGFSPSCWRQNTELLNSYVLGGVRRG